MQKKYLTNNRILFFGLGSIGQRHLRLISNNYINPVFFAFNSNRKRVLLNDNSEKINGDVIKKYKITLIKSLEDIKNYQINIVFICNPSSLHSIIINKINRFNTHVFVEKPIATNLKQVNELIKLSNNSKKNIYTGYQILFNDCFKWIVNFFNKNKINNILNIKVINSEFYKNFKKYGKIVDSYSLKKTLGGGSLLTQIHEINYLIYLFGMPISVSCYGSKRGILDYGVEDSISALIEFKHNRKIFPVFLELSYLKKIPERQMIISDSSLTLKWDYYKNDIYIENINKGSRKTISFGELNRNEMFLNQLHFFFNTIEKKSSFRENFNHSVISTRVATILKKSLENKGEKVFLR